MKGKAPKNGRGFIVNFTPEEKKEYERAARERGESLGELIHTSLGIRGRRADPAVKAETGKMLPVTGLGPV